MRHRLFLVLAASIILLGFTSHSLAQERIDLESIDYSKYRLEMVKVEEAPIIDGLLDDEVWKLSPVGTGFTQFSPDYLAPATERTEVRVLYDDKKLYVGGMCYDSEPEKVVAREMRRDANIYNTDDTFAFTLSAVPDYSIVIMFNTSPGGAQRDAYIGNFGETFNDSWDGIWKVRAKRHDQGWSVEIEIPYKTLRFPNNDVQDWAAIFRRQIRRKRETSYWPPLSRSYGFATWYKMQQGVKLAGMKDVKPGRALEILPYVTLGALGTRRLPGGVTNPTPAQTNIGFETAREAGGNIKWGVTPNITADATVNPDFANIESDPEVVNLSRFEFQFTERRPFFLEGVDLFGFGQSAGFGAFSSGALPLFFSRRIGSPAGGSIIPIDFAAKLSGKTRRTNFAYLNAQTGGLTPSFGPPVLKTNWQVMRIRQDLSRESSIGVMALFKEPDEIMFGFAKNNYNRVLGFDGFFRLGSTQHRVETLLAKSWLPASDPRMAAIAASGQKAKDWAGSLKHSWRGQYVTLTSSYMDVREGFNADMGFIRRRDLRQAAWSASVSNIFIRKSGVRQIGGSFSVNYIDNHQGSFFSNPESWNVRLGPNAELENGTRISVNWEREFDTLSRTTRIGGVHFPQEQYTFDQFSGGIGTNEGKAVVLEADYSQGKFYGGDLRNAGVELTVKPITRLLLNFDISLTQLERKNPVGINPTEIQKANTFINRFRFNYSFTPELYISAFIQLNHGRRTAQNLVKTKTTTVVSNLLLAYQLQSGHSFFIAYNQAADDDFSSLGITPAAGGSPFKISSSAVVAKFQYLFNI